MPSSLPTSADVVVIGAGFGGLATALELAASGARVAVLETLGYPGGCASTFERSGHRFESGATLFSGLDENGLFGRLISKHSLDVRVDLPSEIAEFRMPEFRFRVPADRRLFEERWSRVPGTPINAIRRFFDQEHRIASALWPMLEEPERLVPSLRSIASLLLAGPRLLTLLPHHYRSLEDVLRTCGAAAFAPLRVFIDAVARITVQCRAKDASALFGLAALDYWFHGTGHVEGGIGALARAIADRIGELGSDVAYFTQARRIRRSGRRWVVATRRGEIEADRIVANLLPRDLAKLLDGAEAAKDRLAPLTRAVESGWSAAMLYRVVDCERCPEPEPRHYQLVDDPERELVAGNHVFCSFSDLRTDADGRAYRTLTLSTHVPMGDHPTDDVERARRMGEIHTAMRRTLSKRLPEFEDAVISEFTARPETFARFTGRSGGFVGGIPRLVGSPFLSLLQQRSVDDGLHLIGDSVLMGQSILACASSGMRLAASLR